MEIKKSLAYQFVEFMWIHNSLDSWVQLNSLMHSTLTLAISGSLQFYEDDFMKIKKEMRGGYWFGANSNGKGIGEDFYRTAITENNNTAFQSYEKWTGLKPFISNEGRRSYVGKQFSDNTFRYTVTGFNFETKRIYLVAYILSDWKNEGKRKLFNYDNKEWLTFRKTISEY
jgi:hypothetical protein